MFFAAVLVGGFNELLFLVYQLSSQRQSLICESVAGQIVIFLIAILKPFFLVLNPFFMFHFCAVKLSLFGYFHSSSLLFVTFFHFGCFGIVFLFLQIQISIMPGF